jgi:D-alanine-D-alanine ligase
LRPKQNVPPEANKSEMKVVVLHDIVADNAREDELDVLVEAAAVSKALVALGHEPHSVGFSLDLQAGMEAIRKISPDFIFNLVESVAGHGNLIHLAPALLDYMHIPYSGSPTEALYLTSNKLIAKRLLKGHSIPTPAWTTTEDSHAVKALDGSAFIIKSVWEHASVGIDDNSTFVPESHIALCNAIERAQQQWNREFFAERFIDGREFNISVLCGPPGPEVLPHAEIRFIDYPPEKRKVVDYRAKWDEASFEYHHTIRCFDFLPEDKQLIEKLSSLAKECWQVFGLGGYARVDFRVDKEGNPWVLEINANPCISPDSGFVAAADRAGMNYTEFIARILKLQSCRTP